jgi:hypothetical protein
VTVAGERQMTHDHQGLEVYRPRLGKRRTGSLDQEECVVLTLGKVGKRRMAIGLAPEIATNDACKPLTVALFQHI